MPVYQRISAYLCLYLSNQNTSEMTNPFETIEERLQNIESMLRLMQLPAPARHSTDPALVGIEDAARILMIPKLTIYKRIKEIPHYKPGRHLMFKTSELLMWLESSRKMTLQESEAMVIEKLSKAVK